MENYFFEFGTKNGVYRVCLSRTKFRKLENSEDKLQFVNHYYSRAKAIKFIKQFILPIDTKVTVGRIRDFQP